MNIVAKNILVTVLIIIITILGILYFLWYCQLSANVWDQKMSKYKVLTYIPNKFKLAVSLYDKDDDTIKYPVVFKDNYCTTNGQGVQLIKSKKEATQYLSKQVNSSYPPIVQEYNDYPFEFGISYRRHPFYSKGRIISCVDTTENRKYHLDSDFNELNDKTHGKILFKDCSHLITKALEKNINKVSLSIPGFYVGRYDIKSKSYSDLKRGNFKVIELNGVCGNDLLNGCKFTCRLTRLSIGFLNIISFRAYSPLKMLIIMFSAIVRAQRCKWIENLFIPSSSD